jgi:hypothetical protein
VVRLQAVFTRLDISASSGRASLFSVTQGSTSIIFIYSFACVVECTYFTQQKTGIMEHIGNAAPT